MKKSICLVLFFKIMTIVIAIAVNGENPATDPEVSNSLVQQQPLEKLPPTAINSTSKTNATIPLEEIKSLSSQGSDARDYLESCDPSFRPCNSANKLICDDNICKCMVDPLNPGDRLVYGPSSRKCLPKATGQNGWTCSDGSQCRFSSYGYYSRCKPTIGNEVSICECFDTDRKGREVIRYRNVCYLKKEYGESCSRHDECNGSIQGEAVCLGLNMEENKKGICKCAEGYEFEPSYQECLRLGFINSTCVSHFQCQHESALGPLSVCRDDDQKCTCWDFPGYGQKDTGFSGGRCHYRRGANQTCTQKIECELGYHKDSVCWGHPSYNDEKICQCPEGYTCSGSALPLTVSILTATLSISHFYT